MTVAVKPKTTLMTASADIFEEDLKFMIRLRVGQT